MAERKPRILLVDDDPGVLKVYGKRLEVAGYQVIRSVNGEEALELAKARQPDLVVLDIMLPKMNGYEVCDKLKKGRATKHIPVLMFTAKERPQEHVAGALFGADVYVSKSCPTKVLLDQIKLLLFGPPDESSEE